MARHRRTSKFFLRRESSSNLLGSLKVLCKHCNIAIIILRLGSSVSLDSYVFLNILGNTLRLCPSKHFQHLLNIVDILDARGHFLVHFGCLERPWGHSGPPVSIFYRFYAKSSSKRGRKWRPFGLFGLLLGHLGPHLEDLGAK